MNLIALHLVTHSVISVTFFWKTKHMSYFCLQINTLCPQCRFLLLSNCYVLYLPVFQSFCMFICLPVFLFANYFASMAILSLCIFDFLVCIICLRHFRAGGNWFHPLNSSNNLISALQRIVVVIRLLLHESYYILGTYMISLLCLAGYIRASGAWCYPRDSSTFRQLPLGAPSY